MSVACWNQAALAPEPPLGPSAGLPSSFLHSLWTLFEILDEEGKGFVHLSEIESRWRQQDGDDRLPAGVLLALRQVGAPCAGYLTFPRLVAGLQIALLRDESGAYFRRIPAGEQVFRGLAPDYTAEENECTEEAKTHTHISKQTKSVFLNVPNKWSLFRVSFPNEGGMYRGDVIYPVWSAEGRGVALREETLENAPKQPGINFYSHLPGNCDRRGIGRSRSINSALSQWDPHRIHRARGELRRHTITNGIDYNALKRMKELEQEKDCLLHGLEMVEHARDWYHQQILGVKEEQKNIGQNLSNNDYFSDSQSERSSLLLSKIQEVNFTLSNLMSSSGKGITVPANGLAPPFTQAAKGLGFQQQAMNVLKEQNRLLAKEVSEKSDRITQLEQENVRIFKQLKESRSHRHQGLSHKESTFI
uniref:Suppressor APC domain-containing protein n=1 Tax=Latimeria chalumnae TaxID=7897 RepID=H3B6L9_LATCH